MDQNRAPVVTRRLDAYGRILRRGRILARRREGWAYDEIAREEGLTAERIRQIVREVFRKRPVESGSDHAKLQLARLAPALQAAEAAVLKGEVKAIAPFLKVLDRADRWQKLAIDHGEYDDGARKRLMDKLNQAAERLYGGKADEAHAGEAPQGAEAAPI
jgi:predicted transcriptional regulator